MSKKITSRRKFLQNAAALSTFFILPRHVLGGKGFLAPSDRINIGFIGAGHQAIGLRDRFKATDQVEILAVADVYQRKVDEFIKALGGKRDKSCKGYGDFREILQRKDIDGVVIATPDHWHAVMAVKAAAAGKDIYCEKPLALSVKESRAMADAAKKYGRIFQTGSMQRSAREFRQGVELVRNGYIGDIKEIKISVGDGPRPFDLPAETLPADLNWEMWLGPNEYVPYNNKLNPYPSASLWAEWRYYKGLGGGFQADWGAHMYDIAQWGLNMDHSGPVAIYPPDGQEHPYLTYVYQNGVVMTQHDTGKKNIEFIGTKGNIIIERGKLETNPLALRDTVIGDGQQRVHFSDNHYIDFLSAMRDRSKPVVADAETGHRTSSVCALGNIAYELKRPLKWDPAVENFLNDKEADQLLMRKLKGEWTI
ncbi:Gfo/Idh/MocA family oxidoreductase [Chitinophaga polysaccharea]|uniref:Gfo/Idh/MocA family protein n=1 Tax=Chitinophaga TaxID=79328 RepID=UPI00145528CD|nr:MULTISPECIES: Gfo/Idh/MocA family oxidoreductase [Chitinophaga]NLR60461.1 Gfo/Idh/MocA family oxidoreductase [Chitinophaga polysaccharea]NLU90377.1 Gfo/Idh/MocA family oxidoreductase [Chitinophaga sp. Ak27]